MHAMEADAAGRPDLPPPIERAGWLGPLIAGVTFLVFLPAVFNDFVAWDDVTFVAGNPRFNPPTLETLRFYWTHAGSNLYIPLTYTLWAALAKLAYVSTADSLGTRLNPYIFHLASVLLHVMATVAVFGILRHVVRKRWAAAIGAMLFALHPIQVMAVAFVGATNTPLAAALALPAVWLYLRSGGEAARWRTGSIWLATALFIAAMLAKPTAVVTPVFALLLDVVANRRGPKSAAIAILPWIILALPCIVWTRLNQSGSPAAVAQPILFRPLVAGNAVAFYLGKLILPRQLAIDYGRTPHVVLKNSFVWLTLLVPTAMIAIAVIIRKRQPILTTGIATFLVGMLPNSGLVPFDYQQFSTTADHYVYLSMLGVALGVAALLAQLRRGAIIGIGMPIFVACTFLTERQIATWRDGERLFRHAIEVNPNSWMARTNLATMVMDRSPDEAITLCAGALNAKPDDPSALNNLGSALMQKGDAASAVNAFGQAHAVLPGTPVFAANYARALAMTGRREEAAAVYRRMLDRDPNDTVARAGLANVSDLATRPVSTSPSPRVGRTHRAQP